MHHRYNQNDVKVIKLRSKYDKEQVQGHVQDQGQNQSSKLFSDFFFLNLYM